MRFINNTTILKKEFKYKAILRKNQIILKKLIFLAKLKKEILRKILSFEFKYKVGLKTKILNINQI